MKSFTYGLVLVLALLSHVSPAAPIGFSQVSVTAADTSGDHQPHVARLSVDGTIGPATTDYLTKKMTLAHAAGARAVLLELDTPGGLDAATRDIVQTILGSPLPVITYVYPSGARAASAGTYILYASHIAAMAPATSLGAATPVQMGGNGGDDGEGSAENGSETAMERKAVNDSVAFIRGLAKRHNRNVEWAEQAVRQAVSLPASEALALNVVDIVAANSEDLLAQANKRTVQMSDGPKQVALAGLKIVDYPPSWRDELLGLITNPQIAYILLLVGIYGLILEGYSPGAMVPGIVGVICLFTALYALQVLPVNYAGLALIVIGALLIVAEALAPSFGILGIGGVFALVIGSLILIDTDVPGLKISRGLIGAIGGVSALLLLGVLIMVGRSLRIPRPVSRNAMVGRHATVIYSEGRGGQVRIEGELWQVESDAPLYEGQRVRVLTQEGLNLTVAPAEESEHG